MHILAFRTLLIYHSSFNRSTALKNSQVEVAEDRLTALRNIYTGEAIKNYPETLGDLLYYSKRSSSPYPYIFLTLIIVDERQIRRILEELGLKYHRGPDTRTLRSDLIFLTLGQKLTGRFGWRYVMGTNASRRSRLSC